MRNFIARARAILFACLSFAAAIPTPVMGEDGSCPANNPPSGGFTGSNPSGDVPRIITSFDPNAMEGPYGYGNRETERFVLEGEWLNFRILYENKSTAPAAAQEIRVLAQLAPHLDWNTFEFSEVSIGAQKDISFFGKKGGEVLISQNGAPYKIKMTFSINIETGALSCSMRSWDETQSDSGYWPADMRAGILPPNDDTGRGEGYIAYRVKVKSGVPHLARIDSAATIIFDENDPIPTDPAWFNTVYADAATPAVPVFTTQPAAATSGAYGDTLTLAAAAKGFGDLQYQWFFNGAEIPGATAATLTLPGATPANSGGYSVRVSNIFGAVTSTPASVAVAADNFAITAQPEDAEAHFGAAAEFTVAASGYGAKTYQWYKGSAAVAGGTAATLRFEAVTLADAGEYHVVVTSLVSGQRTSETATLTVEADALEITSEPEDANVRPGANVSFRVEASGEGALAVQWFFNDTAIPGATGFTLALAGVGLDDAGRYSAHVRDSIGQTKTSRAAALVVRPAPIEILDGPDDASVEVGESAVFSVRAEGEGALSYQWFFEDEAIPGATGAVLALAGVTLDDAGFYSVVIRDAYGQVLESALVALRVELPAAPGVEPPAPSETDIDARAGDTVTFHARASGSGLRYQWHRGGVPIPAATAAVLTLANVAPGDSGQYWLVVTDAYGRTATSARFTLTVHLPPPVVEDPAAGEADITARPGEPVSFRVSASGAGLTYRWFKDGLAIPGAIGPAYNIASATAADAGIYTVRVGNAEGYEVESKPFVLTVRDDGSGGDGSGSDGGSDGDGSWDFAGVVGKGVKLTAPKTLVVPKGVKLAKGTKAIYLWWRDDGHGGVILNKPDGKGGYVSVKTWTVKDDGAYSVELWYQPLGDTEPTVRTAPEMTDVVVRNFVLPKFPKKDGVFIAAHLAADGGDGVNPEENDSKAKNSVVQGEKLRLTAQLDVGTGTFIYRWYKNNTKTLVREIESTELTDTFETDVFGAKADGYFVTVETKARDAKGVKPLGLVKSATVKPKVIQPPDITSLAAKPAAAATGKNVSLTAKAKGTAALKYQWYRVTGSASTPGGETLVAIPAALGGNKATLALKKVTIADAGKYRIAVTNASGEKYAESADVTVVVPAAVVVP